MSVGVGLEYWMQWQVFACGLVVLIPLVAASLVILWSTDTHQHQHQHQQHDHHHKASLLRPPAAAFWLPSWRNLHPFSLLLYRVFAFLFMSYLLYLILQSFGLHSFFFYTQWTFALVTIYLALGSVISARGCWTYSRNPIGRREEKDKLVSNKNKSEHNAQRQQQQQQQQHQQPPPPNQAHLPPYLLQQRSSGGFLETSMFIAYQISAGAVVLTDIVFWCLLVPFVMRNSFEMTLLIGCMHSVNAVVLVLDSVFINLPLTWFGLTYLVVWSCSYMVFQWLLHACCITWWPYPFLDLSTPWAPLWYVSLALVHIPCYGVYMLLVKAKNSILSRMFPRAFIRTIPVADDDKKQT